MSANPKDHPSRSSYHNGLMTSRVLATVEQVIIVNLIQEVLRRGSIPVSLEHDGLLILTNNPETLEQCRQKVLPVSKALIGVAIDLESKDKEYRLGES
jgi:hypothetical protein